MTEKTFVLLKPDAVKRGLVGKIIKTFEQAGLNIIALKMVKPTPELVFKHYPETNEWFSILGGKTLDGYAEYRLDVKKELGTDDKVEIGKMIKKWLIEYLTSGSVVAMVLEGNRAIKNVRRLCGNTLPLFADPGSIRGKLSIDSSDRANAEKRPVYNLIHASGEPDEAKYEIELWFPELAEKILPK